VDRHGNVRIYFWRGKGHRKVRMREPVGSKEFNDHYDVLLKQAEVGELTAGPQGNAPKPNTYRWLCVQYFGSTAFLEDLEHSTQSGRRQVLEATLDEPVHPGAKETYADFPISRMTLKSLEVLRDRKAGMKGAQSNRVKALRGLFKWAKEEKHLTSDPARDLAKPRMKGGGHHSWEEDEIEQFEARHPVGTRAGLALALLLYTGVRRSDVVLLGKQHRRLITDPKTGLKEPWFKFTAYKNRNRHPVQINVPVLPELDRVIEASSCGDLAYLVNEHGRPFTVAGFGNKFREWCDEAGLPHCSAHGLRKAGAARVAQNGATAHQLMAIFGWLSLSEAQRYTEAAQRKKMAREAMPLLAIKSEQ
jgi:integrase